MNQLFGRYIWPVDWLLNALDACAGRDRAVARERHGARARAHSLRLPGVRGDGAVGCKTRVADVTCRGAIASCGLYFGGGS